MRSIWLLVWIHICVAVALSHNLQIDAQGAEDPTPVRANLVTSTPEIAQVLAPTITPSLTPTPEPSVRLQALQSAGNVNVRELPDIESDLLGTIAHGTYYPVLRNYYRWYELRFELSPTGRAWVYGDLVTIEGNRDLIEVLDTRDPIAQQGGSTLPGGPNADEGGVNPRTIEIATVDAEAAGAVEVVDATALPTFTPPATQPPFAHQLEAVEAAQPPLLDVPPLLAILALAGLGALGLLISVLRG